MRHYARILTKNTQSINLSEVKELIDADTVIKIDKGNDELWQRITISLSDGTAVCTLERNELASGLLGNKDIKGLLDNIKDAKPESAVNWLRTYLLEVRCVYILQLSNDAGEEGDAVYNALKSAVWSTVGGIIQVDNEGFTNEDGYYILYQFSGNVKGLGYTAIMDDKGDWINFQMDLQDRVQRKEFLEGTVPKEAEMIS